MSEKPVNPVEVNPDVMLGKPVIRGTRISFELVIRKLSEGATEADLLDAYPRLTQEDIQAALAFAADSLAHDVMRLLLAFPFCARQSGQVYFGNTRDQREG